MGVLSTLPCCSDSAEQVERAAPDTQPMARIVGNLNNVFSHGIERAEGTSTTACVKRCEHKAASWKLRMGCVLEQVESGSDNSRESPELKSRKTSSQRQPRDSEQKNLQTAKETTTEEGGRKAP